MLIYRVLFAEKIIKDIVVEISGHFWSTLRSMDQLRAMNVCYVQLVTETMN